MRARPILAVSFALLGGIGSVRAGDPAAEAARIWAAYLRTGAFGIVGDWPTLQALWSHHVGPELAKEPTPVSETLRREWTARFFSDWVELAGVPTNGAPDLVLETLRFATAGDLYDVEAWQAVPSDPSGYPEGVKVVPRPEKGIGGIRRLIATPERIFAVTELLLADIASREFLENGQKLFLANLALTLESVVLEEGNAEAPAALIALAALSEAKLAGKQEAHLVNPLAVEDLLTDCAEGRWADAVLERTARQIRTTSAREVLESRQSAGLDPFARIARVVKSSGKPKTTGARYRPERLVRKGARKGKTGGR